MRLLFSKRADKEANEEFTKYCSVSPELGARFRDELDEKVKAISLNPFLCHNRGGGIFSVRLRVFPYSLFYKIKPDHIRVLAVLHFSRDPDIWKGRK
jgi:toxin ParE1/3/4